MYKKIEIARRLILYPFRLLMIPFMILPVLFTDYSDEWDRNYLKKTLKWMILPLGNGFKD